MELNPKIYVHNGQEVKMTGRTAVRSFTPQTSRRRAQNMPEGDGDKVYEIVPVDSENGTFKRWVPMSELYEIQKEKKDAS